MSTDSEATGFIILGYQENDPPLKPAKRCLPRTTQRKMSMILPSEKVSFSDLGNQLRLKTSVSMMPDKQNAHIDVCMYRKTAAVTGCAPET